MGYFLGVDLGGTKTHMAIADENGRALGFSEAGGGNHQGVGYEGMYQVLQTALARVLKSTGLKEKDIRGAGFGIAGYDWPSERDRTVSVLDRLGLGAPYELVNDAIPGLVAGSEEGWGVGVVSGTGCNCRGWDRDHKREGRVTGYGILMGEAAGGTELAYRAMQMVGFEWMQRGPKTALSQIFIKHNGARDLEDLLEGYTEGRYQAKAEIAPLIFEAARQGDAVAQELIHWAGRELGEMAISVIHQLEFEKHVRRRGTPDRPDARAHSRGGTRRAPGAPDDTTGGWSRPARHGKEWCHNQVGHAQALGRIFAVHYDAGECARASEYLRAGFRFTFNNGSYTI
jgi:N-acetylglucosamine kinase-like BadF-type ATPase